MNDILSWILDTVSSVDPVLRTLLDVLGWALGPPPHSDPVAADQRR